MVDTYLPPSVVPNTRPDVQVDVCFHAGTVNMAELAASAIARIYNSEAALTVPISVPPALLIPTDLVVVRSSISTSMRLVFAEGPGVAMLVSSQQRATTVMMYAADTDLLGRLWDSVSGLARGCRPLAVDDAPITLWSYSGGACPTSDHLGTNPWVRVRRNYPSSTARALDGIMGLRAAPTRGGRLLLWHGPPGTGKTTALTSLVGAWLPWCDTHVVSDPEQLFGNPDYLMSVLQQRAQPNLDEALPAMDRPLRMRWKLIVCEDADEYLRSDARRRSGPALGRLLNATDGILGRNSEALILLTTNDDIGRLHPALTRPGRCLLSVNFPAMSKTEAAAWCPPGASAPAGPTTLAQLYAIAAGTASIEADPATGLYL